MFTISATLLFACKVFTLQTLRLDFTAKVLILLGALRKVFKGLELRRVGMSFLSAFSGFLLPK